MKKFLKNPILPLFLFALIFFNQIIIHFNQMVYPPADIFSIMAPYKIILLDNLKRFGTLPLWNPYSFSGTSFIGNPESSLFYPLTYLYLIFPIHTSFGYLCIFDSILVGIFTYLFARVIKLDKYSSLLASVIIMFSPTLIGLLRLGDIEIFDTFIWFPLILLFYEKSITTHKNLYAILAGIPIALSLLAGSPEAAFYSITAAGIYFVIRLIFEFKSTNRRERIKLLILLCISILTGAALAAVQLLPNQEMANLSARASGVFSEGVYLNPRNFITTTLPHFFGSGDGINWGPGNYWQSTTYIGIIPLFLIVCALFFRRIKFVIVFTLIAFFSLLYSFGNNSFIYPLFQHYFPFAKYFKFTTRFLYVYIFSLSILAGIGFSVLIDELRRKKMATKIFKMFSIITLFCFFFLVVSLADKNVFTTFNKILLNHGYAENQDHFLIFSLILQDLKFLVFILFLITLIFFLFLKKKSFLFLKISLLLLIFFDLFFYSIITRQIQTKNLKQALYVPSGAKEIIDKNGFSRSFRIDNLSISQDNIAKLYSVQDLGPLFLSKTRSFIYQAGPTGRKYQSMFSLITDVTNLDILSLLNVKYIYSKNSLNTKGLILIRKTTVSDPGWTGTYYTYENKENLPRAYIVPNAIILKNDYQILSKLKNKQIDIHKTIILKDSLGNPLKNVEGKNLISITHYEPNQIKLTANLKQPGYLVLSEIWYPGWKVFINNKQQKILEGDTIFRVIYLNKGNNNVVFAYDPLTYKIGFWISVAALCSIIIFFGYLLIKKKILDQLG